MDDDLDDIDDEFEELYMAKRRQELANMNKVDIHRTDFDRINKVILEYIRANWSDVPYSIYGGKAAEAWLNLDMVENEHIKDVISHDIDIKLAMNVHQMIKFVESFQRQMSKMGIEFIIKQGHNDIFGYLIRLCLTPCTNDDHYLIDITLSPIDKLKSTRVIIDEIYYINLKTVIDDLSMMIAQPNQKLVKRTLRHRYTSKALDDSIYLNKNVYLIMKNETDRYGVEQMSGYQFTSTHFK